MAMHEPDVDKLKHEITYEQWSKWERFYEQDPWGELRQDMRTLAAVLHILNPNTDVKMFHPYFGDDDADEAERYDKLQAEFAALGPERIQESLARGREKYKAQQTNG